MSGDQPVQRFVLSRWAASPMLLELEGEDADIDLDLVVWSADDGEFLYSSTSYSSSEAVLVPKGSGDLLAEVFAFDLASDASCRYRLGLFEPLEVIDRPRPLALYEMIHPPGTPRAGEVYRIVVYQARLRSLPRNLQEDEVLAVIALTLEQVIRGPERKT